MGTLRICTYDDNHNPDIPRDEDVDLAGVVFLGLRKYESMSFELYYNNFYNHENVYKSWKNDRII